MRWNDRSDWIWSAKQTHEALVSPEDFAAVLDQMAAGAHRPTVRKGARGRRQYALSGLVHCEVCGRRMQNTYAHETARYRCTFPKEYALANTVEHPATVYVREDAITSRLDEWIVELFDDDNLDETCKALEMASGPNDEAEARAEAARRKIADCDKRLAKYRQTLDADGALAATVAGWMAEVQGERLRAEQELGASVPGDQLSRSRSEHSF